MDTGPQLEAPQVLFPPGFALRLERLAGRARRAHGAGGLREGRGVAARGFEFAGYRAYRPGEDVRHLDWALLARLDRPFVREHARAAGERWRILLDTSGSMGLGAPGKLSAAAALALALAAVGAQRGVHSSLRAARAGSAPLALEFTRRADLPRWLAALGALRSERGARDDAWPGVARGRWERVFALGDLQGLDLRRLSGLRARGRRVVAVVLIAPHERALPPGDAARLVDREGQAELELALAPADRARWTAALSAHLESLRARARAGGIELLPLSSDAPFEEGVRALLEARG
jgi:uncharacterized protein (DUF58 family)